MTVLLVIVGMIAIAVTLSLLITMSASFMYNRYKKKSVFISPTEITKVYLNVLHENLMEKQRKQPPSGWPVKHISKKELEKMYPENNN